MVSLTEMMYQTVTNEVNIQLYWIIAYPNVIIMYISISGMCKYVLNKSDTSKLTMDANQVNRV